MAIKIKLKNSVVANKAPLPTDLDIGEVAINANAASPAAYIKDSAGAVVKLAGAGSISTPDATAAIKGIDTQKWTRTGTELSPATAGDSVFTTGAVKVGGTTAAPNLQIKADGGIVANTNGLVYDVATKRLGLGTTSPGSALEIDAAAYTSPFIAKINTAEAARIDGSGRLLVGTSTMPTFRIFNADRTDSKHIITNSGTSLGASFSVVQWAGNSAGGWGNDVVFAKSFSGTVGTHTIGGSGNLVNRLFFSASDGTRFVPAASIETFIDGTPGDLDMPGRLVFSTTADGASSPTERMRIKSTGVINFSNAPVYADNAAAKAGGLVNGDVYRKSDGTLMIVYT